MWTVDIAIEYLEDKGYELQDDRTWLPPWDTHKPRTSETEAAQYLMEMAGYGPIVLTEWSDPVVGAWLKQYGGME